MKTQKSNQSKNRSSKLRGVLEILLVIGLILIIPLFFAIKSVANAPAVQGTGTPYARATATSAPQSKPLISSSPSIQTNAKEPPPCTFPLAQITTSQSTPENYTFSEPKVVLTAPKGNIYNIAEWLPDNQQVLMTEELGSSVEYGKPAPESIELYNPETGNTKVYATRPISHELPAWVPQLNAVVYPALNFLGKDQNTGISKFTHQIWISYGDPATAQKLADNLPQLPFAVKPDGSQTLYFSDKQLSKWNASMQAIPSTTSFDPTQWDYGKARDDNPVSYEMAWQPGTSLVFLYSEGAMDGGGYTFILNADTGRVCELKFGGWAQTAHWSSDGRYLAIIRSTTYGFPTYSAELTVLDTTTGKLTTLDVIPQEIEGQHYVDDFVWAPDNRHLLAIGDIDTSRNSQDKIGLYLVDFVSGQSVNILPAYALYTNSPQSMAWSPDGSKLVVRCPTQTVDQICFTPVHNGQ
ncbi:MAG TPA: hypothetical protein VIN60_10635 [Anaerolineales bacterium]